MNKSKDSHFILKKRSDQLLVEQGLVADLKNARALIMTGVVHTSNMRIDKPGMLLQGDTNLFLKQRKDRKYVSRGGRKLEFALTHFKVNPDGLICLDLGASTGGFTDCLLQNGAKKVYAVDVAYGILDWKLQQDSHVINLERIHAAKLTSELIPDRIALLTADISFNSLHRIIPYTLHLLDKNSQLLLLIKPQFEAAQEEVGTGGIVTDPETHKRVCNKTEDMLKKLDLAVIGLVESTIKGAKGNIEYFVYCQST